MTSVAATGGIMLKVVYPKNGPVFAYPSLRDSSALGVFWDLQ